MNAILMRTLALVVLMLPLTACVASPEELLARDRMTCTEIGFPGGSERYENRVLQLQSSRLGRHH